MSQCARQRAALLACVSAISKDTLDEGKQSPCPAQQMEGAIAILNVSRMNDDVQQEAQRVDQDVPFATFDLLCPRRSPKDRTKPPF